MSRLVIYGNLSSFCKIDYFTGILDRSVTEVINSHGSPMQCQGDCESNTELCGDSWVFAELKLAADKFIVPLWQPQFDILDLVDKVLLFAMEI